MNEGDGANEGDSVNKGHANKGDSANKGDGKNKGDGANEGDGVDGMVVAAMVMVVRLVGQLFHIYDMRQMRMVALGWDAEPVQQCESSLNARWGCLKVKACGAGCVCTGGADAHMCAG